MFKTFISFPLLIVLDLPHPYVRYPEFQFSIFLPNSVLTHLCTYTNHFEWFSFIFSLISSTSRPFLMSSFRILFLKIYPLNYLSNHISATLIFSQWFFSNAQHFDQYTSDRSPIPNSRSVQNRPDNMTFIRPCNQTRL